MKSSTKPTAPQPTIRNSSNSPDADGPPSPRIAVSPCATMYPNRVEAMIATPPMVGVPRLTRWPGGPSLRISCPKPRSRKYRTITGVNRIENNSAETAASRIVFTPARPPLRAFARVNGRRRGVPERDGDSFEACGSGCLHEYHVSGPKLVLQQYQRSIRVGDPRRLTIPGAFQSGAVCHRPGGRTHGDEP